MTPLPNILMLNGPNLNMLGQREEAHYGADTLQAIQDELVAAFPQLRLEMHQSNHEGDLIDQLHNWAYYSAIVINAGAYSHYSYAIQDALRLVRVPVVEVHLSNIYARETFRHTSVISPVVRGVISGFGKDSYRLALYWLSSQLSQQSAAQRGKETEGA